MSEAKLASRQVPVSRDPRANAPLPMLILAWLAESGATRLQDWALRPSGSFRTLATRPSGGPSFGADMAALRAARSQLVVASLREPEATRALLRREAPAHCDAVMCTAERVLAGGITLLGARWRRWQTSLRDHLRCVRWCLEWGLLYRGNHYLANVIGLGAIAAGVPGISSQRETTRQERRLAREAHRALVAGFAAAGTQIVTRIAFVCATLPEEPG